MSFLPASRTTRRLFKIASLGLAGLVAGLLSGCTSVSASTASYSHATDPSAVSRTYSADPDGSEDAFSRLPKSLDARQVPELRHPPSARRLESGSVQGAHLVMATSGHSRS